MSKSVLESGDYAFPCFIGGSYGMTLRDWFAGMALQGMLCANAPAMDEVTDQNVDAVLAREAYASADAMLKAREA